ncbi:MAG: phospholipase [Chloroflexi bacterium]|nr:phospholipase [Chloroflexota bacterium]
MKTENKRFQWLPTLIILWNIIDIVVHVSLNMAEPLRITGNIVGIAAALIVLLGIAKPYAPHILGGAAVVVVVVNAIHAAVHGFVIPMLVFVGFALFLLLRWTQVILAKGVDQNFYYRWWMALVAALVGVGIITLSGPRASLPIILNQLHNGALEGADYWRDEPMILSAGMGFDNIIGVPELTEKTVREAGGSWYGSLTCANGKEPSLGHRTSTTLSNIVGRYYKGYADYDDGLPIVFSWPVASETVDVTDFKFTLNTGEVVFPHSAGMVPNWELNERNVVVVFGDFGNRGKRSEADVIFPVQLEIVADETPLLLIGPGGREFNAVGLTWATDTTAYDRGPFLVGAKLNYVGSVARGEGGVPVLDRGSGLLPNDEFALYDEGDFRLRILTTGGFSPDGVTGVTPDMYEDFFRIHVKGADGETILLEKVGVAYSVAGGTLRVVGLSDLGQKESPKDGVYYDGCYSEDRDNYIDIILVGDEKAARNITFVEIPSLKGGYRAFYVPGGPGPEPFEGVRYTAPGPADMEPVIIALDNPMRVDRAAP